MKEKLESILERYNSLNEQLNNINIVDDVKLYKNISKEKKMLSPIIEVSKRYLKVVSELEANKELINSPGTDNEFKELAYLDNEQLNEELEKLEEELKILLIPKDPNDFKNCIFEIRAGTGGDEAGIFAGDLFRMYQRYAERVGLKLEVIDFNESERGGFKEMVFSISGEDVYGKLKYESGVHRVQRVPDTEANGRIHTSAATVAVLPEAEDVDIDIK
ncbi:MAG TPA: PCRF domain-containing protein, partial [Candidatus Kapabacteria bacterium]|nr:PCRF domain-containing protein [Candidatus Kapabacteria bacterium]